MATARKSSRAFVSPFGVATPPSCAGWEEMYPYHVQFSADRRSFDEARLWFHDAVHGPEPLHPFDFLWWDYGVAAMNQMVTRLFVFPPSMGTELRVLNGYVYLSANSVTDENVLAHRAELYPARGGHYYRHWDELYEHWVDKMEAATRDLELLEVPDLPEVEDEEVVTEARGIGSGFELLAAYDRLLEGLDRVMQYHFELAYLGYGAYLTFYEQCRRAFPDISDQTIAKMLSGIDLLVLRPDEELKRLARLALELGVAEAVASAADEAALRSALSPTDGGAEWLADFDKTKNPWFYFSNGNGLYHHHGSWIDDMRLPIGAIGAYVRRLQAGEDISRPYASVLAERDRITDEYRSLLSDESREAFEESLALGRTVFPFIENHNFYIEHRYFTIFWNAVRRFGSLLARHAFLAGQEDVFYLRHDEVRSALDELRMHWGSGGAGAPRGPGYWPPIVARRKAIYEAMRTWAPPPALGPVPETITDPVAIMLWGITDRRIDEWLSTSTGSSDRTLTGFAASPGIAEGLARVILHAEQLGEVQQHEILVAASTSTSWTPVFGEIDGAVLDSGGIMCHAAIIAREYGLPTVVGTGTATKRIRTGDRLRVDADAGIVTILD